MCVHGFVGEHISSSMLARSRLSLEGVATLLPMSRIGIQCNLAISTLLLSV